MPYYNHLVTRNLQPNRIFCMTQNTPKVIIISFLILMMQSTHSFADNLLSIYKQASDQDPQLAAARINADAAKEKPNQGFSQFLPKINASADASYTKQDSDFESASAPDGNSTSPGHSIQLQLIQPIYNRTNNRSYDKSKLVANQSEIQYQLSTQELILRVANAYFNVLSAKENVAVAKAQTIAFNENLERAKLTFKVGTATKTDKLEAQARYDLARASEISASNQYEISRQTLASIIGSLPDTLSPLKKQIELIEIKPKDMKHWVDQALGNNYQLKIVNETVKIAREDINSFKGNHWPTLDFVANANRSSSHSSTFDSDLVNTTMSVALQLKLPLYTGGLTSSQVREAQLFHSREKQNRITTQRNVILQTQQAYLNALNGRQQIDALKQALLSSESALDATRKGVEVGVRTNLDLLDAQQQFFSTERDYRVAKHNYLITVLELEAAAGNLTEDDVVSMNKLLAN